MLFIVFFVCLFLFCFVFRKVVGVGNSMAGAIWFISFFVPKVNWKKCTIITFIKTFMCIVEGILFFYRMSSDKLVIVIFFFKQNAEWDMVHTLAISTTRAMLNTKMVMSWETVAGNAMHHFGAETAIKDITLLPYTMDIAKVFCLKYYY
jgi:hypothetical protein